jgi:predicted MarR family transcription regulator
MELTEKHAELRRSLLTSMVSSIHDWDNQARQASQLLNILRGLFEQATTTVTFHVGVNKD